MKLFGITFMIEPLAIEKYCNAIKDKIIFDGDTLTKYINWKNKQK